MTCPAALHVNWAGGAGHIGLGGTLTHSLDQANTVREAACLCLHGGRTVIHDARTNKRDDVKTHQLHEANGKEEGRQEE